MLDSDSPLSTEESKSSGHSTTDDTPVPRSVTVYVGKVSHGSKKTDIDYNSWSVNLP